MKYLNLSHGVKGSKIGFSCSKLNGSFSRQESMNQLNLAFEGGITHFDVARSYGYGNAELFLGNFLNGKRHNFIVESKFGIIANKKARILRPFLPVLRQAAQAIPRKKQSVIQTEPDSSSKYLNRFHSRILLNEKTFVSSLEASLKALKTDYIDTYYIHEPYAYIDNIDDLLALSNKLKEQGKIKYFGLAFESLYKNVHQPYLDSFDVLQFNLNPAMSDYDWFKTEFAMKRNLFLPNSFNIENLELHRFAIEKMSHDFPQSTFLYSKLDQALLENIDKVLL